MKRLIGLILLLLLISGLGYFALLNSHNVAVHLYGSFTLQFAVWTLIIGSFVLGFLLSEARVLFSSPQGWIRRLRILWEKREEKQRLRHQDHFQEVVLEGNYNEIEKTYRLLEKDPETPLQLKIQHLEQLRFFENPQEVLLKYDEMMSDEPDQIELELSYFRMLIRLKDWDRLEEQSVQMKKKLPDHPEVLEGLSKMMAQKQLWKECVELEQRLLEQFPKKHTEIFFLEEHTEHLKKSFQQDPQFHHRWDSNYLKNFLPDQKIRFLNAIAEVELLRSQNEYEKGSELCTNHYLESGEMELLLLWEDLFLESGKKSSVLDTLKQAQHSKKRNAYATLILAKAHYQRMEFEKSAAIISRLNWPEGSVPELHQALNFMLARQGHRELELPYLISEWLPEERMLGIPLENMKIPDSSSLLEMHPKA